MCMPRVAAAEDGFEDGLELFVDLSAVFSDTFGFGFSTFGMPGILIGNWPLTTVPETQKEKMTKANVRMD